MWVWLALAPPMLIGGLLPVDQRLASRWPFAAAWIYPIGDPMRLGSASGGEPAFQMTRGVTPGVHDGADLSNRRAGDPVRAAGSGVVIATGEHAEDGYGVRVVLAHREPDGRILYTVYAHLAAGSVRVGRGETVSLGGIVGRVGMTGRATSPHLHFEVRVPDRVEDRWEKAAPVDPVAFVEARLPSSGDDTTRSRSYLVWAEAAGLLRPGPGPGAVLERGEWWCALAGATGATGDTLTRDPALASMCLGRMGVVDHRHLGKPETPPAWKEVAHDLTHARHLARRLPPVPVPAESLRAAQRRTFGFDPVLDPRSLARLERDPLTRAEAALLFADVAGPARAARHRRLTPPAAHGTVPADSIARR
ncbi:MAG: M23 family metallopeptidase [Candidatus Eisenbacteria bacterium]